MLRACQFAARFNYALSDGAADAIRAAAPLAATVAPERVAEEIWKLLRAPRPSYGIEWMRETGVLEWIWPELLEGFRVAQNEWHAYDVYRHNLETLDAAPAADPVLRLAALLHDIGKPRTKDGPHFYRHEHAGEGLVHAMLARLRLAREVEDTVAHLVRQHMYGADPDASPATIRRFIRRVGPDHLERLFALRRADVIGSGLPKRGEDNERFEARVRAILDEKPAFSVRDLAIGGDRIAAALVARGLAAPGFRGDERVGEVLRYLFEQVTDEPDRNDPAQLSALVERYISEHLSSP
jgi:tRNA nucleotidyltransferase (CCA-adding enzyme)